MFTKKMKLVVVAAILALTAGCSTMDYRGEGMSAGVLLGAGAGYLISGGSVEGVAVGAAVGGLAGNFGGRMFKKKYGYEEAELSLMSKRNAVTGDAMNRYFICVDNVYTIRFKELNAQMAAVDASARATAEAQENCHWRFIPNTPKPQRAAGNQ